MFDAETYARRRRRLAGRLGGGIALLPGHNASSVNFAGNCYPFRQDGSFLYFFAHARPGLVGLIDADAGDDRLFGPDPEPDAVIWEGPQPSLAQLAQRCAAQAGGSHRKLDDAITAALAAGRTVHYLPPYRAETRIQLHQWTGRPLPAVPAGASLELVDAVVGLREVKSPQELDRIASAVDLTAELFAQAAAEARPGIRERAIAAAIEAAAAARGAHMAFAPVVTVNGQILHNPDATGTLADGRLLLVDAGAQIAGEYAADITRCFPVGGRFTDTQRAVYQLVLDTQQAAIAECRPEVPFRQVHLAAARRLTAGLQDLGVMQGDVDAAVAQGAHALLFPHGLGHLMGLDVHDMEALGEDRVGYDRRTPRSDQFGLSALRFARPLKPGHVITVEPGLYFNPALMDRWQAEGRHADFIRYDRLAHWRAFGGIRIEDDIVVTADGAEVLSAAIPKSVAKMERCP